MNIKTLFSIGIIFLFSSVFASAALDLAFVGSITQSPDPSTAGTTVTFSVSFRTNGGAVTNLKITGGVDGTQLFERTYASILADKTKTDTFTWTATGGNHTIWFELDSMHTCGDSDYGNNRIEKVISIGSITPAVKPNLTVSATYNPLAVTNGANITFTATVTNSGDVPAAPSKLGFYVFGGLHGEYDVPALNVGQKHNVTINWVANCIAPCNAYIHIDADSTNIIDESNENDNQWLKQGICNCASNYKANLTVSATYSPAKPKNGDKVTFNMTVMNDGEAESSRVYLGFYLSANLIHSFEISPMAKHTKEIITYEWLADCGQNCLSNIDLFVDNQNETDESNENDNHWIKDIKCDCGIFSSSAIKKGLVLRKDLTLQLSNLMNSTRSYICYPGKKKVDLVFVIKNTGQGPAGGSKLLLKVFDGNNLIFTLTKDVQPLAVNQTTQVKIDSIYCVHNAKMIVDIDSENEVVESNENDNQWYDIINCQNL